MKQPGDSLADNMKRIREHRNLSLDKLADLTGVSKSMLRQIEIDQSNPTIATLWKIANGLRIPFTALLKEDSQNINLKAFKQDPPLRGNTKGYRLFPLLPFTPERSFEAYYVEIDPGTVLNAEPHKGNAEEHIFVLSGQINVTVAADHHRVDRENLISFQANCDHRYENTGEQPAAAMMLISYQP